MEPANTEVYDQLEKQFDAFYRSVTLNEPVMVDGNAGLNALILAEKVQVRLHDISRASISPRAR